MSVAETLAKVALRLSVLSRDGIAAPQAAWLDETLKIANAGLAEATGVAGANGYAAVAGEEDSKRTTASGDGDDKPVHDMSKFLKVSEDLQLVRFRGDKFVRYVGRTPAHDGNPPCCWEIEVDKPSRVATCTRNGEIVYTMKTTCGWNVAQSLAISALHRWFKDRKYSNKRSRASRKRRREDAKVADPACGTGAFFTPLSVADEIVKAEGGSK